MTSIDQRRERVFAGIAVIGAIVLAACIVLLLHWDALGPIFTNDWREIASVEYVIGV
jgi:hypothetical protein